MSELAAYYTTPAGRDHFQHTVTLSWEGQVCGLARLGRLLGASALLDFGLIEGKRALEPGRRILEALLAELGRGLPDLRFAVYDDAHRPLFEAAGFRTLASFRRLRAELPVARGAPLPALPGLRPRPMARDDEGPLADLIATAGAAGPPDPEAVAAACGAARALFERGGAPPIFDASFVVPFPDGRPGLAAAAVMIGVPGGPDADCAEVAVHPSLRRRGSASALLRASLDALAGLGYRRVQCALDAGGDAGAARLLEKLGFAPEGPLLHRGRLERAPAPRETPAARWTPPAGAARDLGPIAERLRRAGYDEAGVLDILDGVHSQDLLPPDRPGCVWRCRREDSPRAALLRLFILSHEVERAAVEAAIGADAVEALLRHRVLAAAPGGRVAASVDLYPVDPGDGGPSAYVVTDRRFSSGRPPEYVYELQGDSYALAHLAPRRPAGRALDLCTGSGIHAVLAARHCASATGVDLNPRALAFARLNAALNGVAERCELLEGDLYAPASGSFDLILANPPWVPNADPRMEIFRGGGETGEEITRRVIAGAPERLAPGGTLAMFACYPILRGGAYLDRLRSWLGGGAGFGIALLELRASERESYIRGQLREQPGTPEFEAELARWLDCYERHGIDAIGTAMVYVRRLRPGHPGYAERSSATLPPRPFASEVARWLDALERWLDPELALPWDLFRPALAPGVRLWLHAASGEGLLDSEGGFTPEDDLLPPDEALLASWLDGRKTAGELADEWARRKGLSAAAGRARVHELLRSLGLRGAIEWCAGT